jgi:hypothetical protein
MACEYAHRSQLVWLAYRLRSQLSGEDVSRYRRVTIGAHHNFENLILLVNLRSRYQCPPVYSEGHLNIAKTSGSADTRASAIDHPTVNRHPHRRQQQAPHPTSTTDG